MNQIKDYSLIALRHFIHATRDSGYRGTAWALAELVDNSFEADATCVDICVSESQNGNDRQLTIAVTDNGIGMTPSVLRLALQFGGSTRFNSRNGTGRYGMGLPNSSLNQARRMDVYSWTKPNVVWWSYLDVDEIASGKIFLVPKPRRVKLDPKYEPISLKNGTLVVWSRCDRLEYKKGKTLTDKLHLELGRIFRHQLWSGRTLKINGRTVQTVDPLFLRKGNNLLGATAYGPALKYEINVPQCTNPPRTSTVQVTFTELPIRKWHSYSNEDKRQYGIAKNAGVSIVRSGREIDYGWFFMGGKRKENYDDWWRCEISFDAPLDELFGVTLTKQGIHPTEAITNILTPDLERVAHELNRTVRKTYLEVKSSEVHSIGGHRAESRDHLLEPPSRMPHVFDSSLNESNYSTQIKQDKKSILSGFAYRIEQRIIEEVSFFVPLYSGKEIVVLLNKEHPFYEKVYGPISRSQSADLKIFCKDLELLLFAVARAECCISERPGKDWARDLRESWSNTLAAFLT